MSGSADLNDENLIQIALQLNHIRIDKSSPTSPFNCNVCMVPFSGVAPLRQHLASAKHKKKIGEQNLMSDLLPNLSPKANSICSETDLLNKSLVLGHVRRASDSFNGALSAYFCEICQVPLSGEAPLRQHVNSPNHAKKLRNKEGAFDMSGLETSLTNIGTTEVSYLVTQAIKDGHVRKDRQSSTGAYFCNICNVSLSGEKPLEQHLQGSSHSKKLNVSPYKENSPSNVISANLKSASRDLFCAQTSFQASQQALQQFPKQDTQQASQQLPEEFANTLAHSMNGEADLLNKSLILGHVRQAFDSFIGTYFCEICQVPLSGEAPLRQHVNSPNHNKKLRNKEYALDLSGLKTSLSNIGTMEVSSLVTQAIKDGHVHKDELSSTGAYFCDICNVSLTGEKPLEQHLQGSSHSKKLYVSPYKENTPSNLISPLSSACRDLFSAQTSFQTSLQALQQLPEEIVDISDILVIHAHEPVDSLFN